MTMVPITIGWLKPIILIPASAIAMLTPAQLELVIAHEIAHIRRNDFLVNQLQIYLEVIFFYHPAVHSISAFVRLQREARCDEQTCKDNLQRFRLAKALLVLEQNRQYEIKNPPAMVLAANGGELLQRVTYLLKHSKSTVTTGGLTTTIAVLCAPIVLMVISSKSEYAAPSQMPPVTDALTSVLTAESIIEQPIYSVDLNQPLVLLDDARQSDKSAVMRIAGAINPIASAIADDGPVLVPDVDTNTGGYALRQASEPSKEMDQVIHHDISKIRKRISGFDQYEGGRLLTRVLPKYPVSARMRGYGDIVTARFTVTELGDVINIEVRSAAREYRFKNAVAKALAQWRYEPLLRNGQRIAREVEETIHFSLDPRWAPEDMCRVTPRILLNCASI